MIRHSELNQSLLKLVRKGEIKLAGNAKLKIYGSLHCRSGKRMKKENRVFFTSEAEAIQNGFRPCGNCMRKTRNPISQKDENRSEPHKVATQFFILCFNVSMWFKRLCQSNLFPFQLFGDHQHKIFSFQKSFAPVGIIFISNSQSRNLFRFLSFF